MEATLYPLIALTLFLPVITAAYFIRRDKKRTLRLKFLEERIHRSDENLFGKAKFSELGLMSAGITHEISNPLTIIQMKTAQLLRIYRDPAQQKELARGLQVILYASERMGRTIQSIRDYIYQNEQTIEEQINLRELLDDVLVFCGERLHKHGIELRLIDLDKVFIKGNRIQLEQAILNLINNSFDAVDKLPEKWIEIIAVETSENVDIYFKDSGDGIPEAVVEKIMEPFFSTKKHGTGLGLALVKDIAEKHHGSFHYVNKSAHTTFMLELPKTFH
jgi:C4-dicarboxylate-specific signal transduction histidine kinase